MLAHLKAKQRDDKTMPSTTPKAPPSNTGEQADVEDKSPKDGACSSTLMDDDAEMTCDALCSLSSTPPPGSNSTTTAKKNSKSCPKQHQLPMFLSKTYHMIDKCDPEIATWSADGANFVVKNADLFASNVLPQYFKHSNFSSFARQLNFYGFRKLKAEPILTADFDARTANYVRFYHDKFQKDRPELLSQIKRATKSEQQSKDDVDSLKMEIAKLKECMANMTCDFDRRMAELSYEYNRRITMLSADHDKLALLVQQLLTQQGLATKTAGAVPASKMPDMMQSLSHVAAMSLLSRAPHSLAPAPIGVSAAPPENARTSGEKRAAEEQVNEKPESRARTN